MKYMFHETYIKHILKYMFNENCSQSQDLNLYYILTFKPKFSIGTTYYYGNRKHVLIQEDKSNN